MVTINELAAQCLVHNYLILNEEEMMKHPECKEILELSEKAPKWFVDMVSEINPDNDEFILDYIYQALELLADNNPLPWFKANFPPDTDLKELFRWLACSGRVESFNVIVKNNYQEGSNFDIVSLVSHLQSLEKEKVYAKVRYFLTYTYQEINK